MIHGRRWCMPAAVLSAVLVFGAACRDTHGPGIDQSTHLPPLLATLILSNPTGSAHDIVYAALPPDAVTDGRQIVIRTRRTGVEVAARLVAGGLDPFAVRAKSGDTLDLTITLTSGAERAYIARVPEARPPVVVRTNPAPGQEGVPLSEAPFIVFSEPISASTLSTSSMALWRDTVPVAGTLAFKDSAHLTAAFSPTHALDPSTTYALVATDRIQDVDGDPLAAVTVTFETIALSPLSAVILSNPREPAGIAYASIHSGRLPGGERISLQSRRTGTVVAAALAGGGLDPVAVAAQAGDTLDIRITFTGSDPVRGFAVVPERQPPLMVRSDPTGGRRFAPLTAAPLIVFSEPIDPATLLLDAIQLLHDGRAVPGTLAFVDGDHLTAQFTPSEALDRRTNYSLVATAQLRDLDGDPLVPATIGFVTGADLSSPAEAFDRATPSSGAYHDRYLLHESRDFELRIHSEQFGDVAFIGEYWQSDSVITFLFDDDPQWTARGTRRGDTLTVAYDIEMQLSDFEDGVYLRDASSPPPSPGWTSLAPLPEARWQPGAAAFNGIVYVAGGVVDRGAGWEAPAGIVAYDPGGDRWRPVGELARPVRAPAMAAVGEALYVVGGCRDDPWEPVADLQVVDPATGNVAAGPPMPTPRCGLAVAVLDGRIHAIGGVVMWDPADPWSSAWSTAHEVFDPATGAWSSRAPLPSARGGHGAAVVGGKIYVWGGLGDLLQVYDPVTDSWTTSPAAFGRFATAAAALHDQAYFFGGGEYPRQGTGGPVPTGAVDRFDPATGSWESMPPMPTARSGHAAAVVGGSAYVIGGSSTGSASDALAVVERYTPE